MILASVLGDTWRMLISVGALAAIIWFWYTVITRVRPF